jgi:hypothetical protein
MKKMFARGAIALSLSLLAACGGQETAGKGTIAITLSSSAGTGSTAVGARAALALADSNEHDGGAQCVGTQAASVTFSAILARTVEGKLVDATIDLPVTVDLLALVNGKQATLPAGYLPQGTYDQFVVVIAKVELTLASGTKIAVTPPGGGWTAVVPVSPPFTVTDGQTTTVTLNFRRDRSFACAGSKWEFHPEFECRHGDHH